MMVCKMPGFPENTRRSDYIRKILGQSAIGRAPGEGCNVAAVRSDRGANYMKVSEIVDEVPV
jgi:hypothetical protein